YLRYVYYDSLGELYAKIKNSFGDGDFVPPHDIFQLGFWPGGDRDGNPFVTAETTLQVAKELNTSVLKSYYEHLKKLRRRLSFRGVSEVLDALSDEIYDAIFKDHHVTSDEILNRIHEAQQILNGKHNGLFGDLLDDFEDRVKIFGTHFATLDIRQDSRVHQNIIDVIVAKESGLQSENI